MELAPISIVAMAGTLRLSPPLLHWASAEDGDLPTGNGTSRAWLLACVASLASVSATCCCGDDPLRGRMYLLPSLSATFWFTQVLRAWRRRASEGSGVGVSDCSRAVVPVGSVVTGSE